MRVSRFIAPILVATIVVPLTAAAISFPDVKADYAHRVAIEKLSDLGVIGGNPDGTFRPRDPVDRASILKMLYKAAGITPSAKTGCFSDVPKGAWFEAFVCDAVARGYVKGYEEGALRLFKPGRPVTRAEALKLAIVVLGVKADVSASVTMYADVSKTDWMYEFVHTALARGILPVAGQDGALLQSSLPLERGEAAAYIWNGLAAKGRTSMTPTPTAAVSSAPTPTSSVPGNVSSRKRVEDAASQDVIVQKEFPFTDSRVYSERKPVTFVFRVGAASTVAITGTTDAKNGRVTCRLYRIETSGFSTEYYIGHQEEAECRLVVALAAGDYQLLAETSVADARIAIDARAGSGDGNDGYSQAKSLDKKIRVETLEPNDLADWFTFTVTKDTSTNTVPGTEQTVKVTSATELGCLITPLADVDLFGFEGPQCNQLYKYPVGTYMVTVRHPVPRASRETYTIELR